MQGIIIINLLFGVLVVTTREHYTQCFIFPCPCRARKNTTQLVKYLRVLSIKTPNKAYVFLIPLPNACKRAT